MNSEPPKTKVASFRLSAEAHAKLTARAREAGISGRAWFERAILDNQTEIVARPQQHPELKALLFQAAKAGNNLNQLAHRFNALRLEGRMSQQDCARALATLDEIYGAFREAVARADSR
ncbi:plasmid mobilization relaxosome protein MobC [Variovorax sp. KK3]|uniref:plasmid mobilization protein n=1 Tax=Variovorax sp. KK3 TaxID=1855728 RepID=UPI00097BF2D8|nr:plasmid mobilization relaxosome protein MobC [Variovorax sp. KK3]